MVSRLSSGVTGAMCDSGHQAVAVVPHSRQHRGLRHEDAGVLMGTAQVGEGAAACSIWRFHGQMGRMTARVRKLQQEEPGLWERGWQGQDRGGEELGAAEVPASGLGRDQLVRTRKREEVAFKTKAGLSSRPQRLMHSHTGRSHGWLQ